MYEDIWKDFG